MNRKLTIGLLIFTTAIVLYGNRYKFIERGDELTRIDRLTLKAKVFKDGKWRTPKSGTAGNSYGNGAAREDLEADQLSRIQLSSFTASGRGLNVEVYNGSSYHVTSLVFEVTFKPDGNEEPLRRIHVSQSSHAQARSVGNQQLYLGSKEVREVASLKIVGGAGVPATIPSVRDELLTAKD